MEGVLFHWFFDLTRGVDTEEPFILITLKHHKSHGQDNVHFWAKNMFMETVFLSRFWEENIRLLVNPNSTLQKKNKQKTLNTYTHKNKITIHVK